MIIVTVQGSPASILLIYTTMTSIPSISLGSLKLEAHKETLTNSVAGQMKINFLEDELDFLNDFSESIQILKETAKAGAEVKGQVERVAHKMEVAVGLMGEEVGLVRREISDLGVGEEEVFDSRVSGSYEDFAIGLDNKAVLMEETVQEREGTKKIKGSLDQQHNVTFRKCIDESIIEAYLSYKVKVKREMKRRLDLIASLKDRLAKQVNELQQSKNKGHSQRQYLWKRKQKQYYPNKSKDSSQLSPPVDKPLMNKGRRKQRRSQPQHKIPLKHLARVQRQIFEDAFTDLKTKNMKIEVYIKQLKEAISQRQNREVLRLLQKNERPEMQEALSRQLLASQQLSRKVISRMGRFRDEWLRKGVKGKRKSGSKVWQWQQERKQEVKSRMIMAPKPKSLGKGVKVVTDWRQFVEAMKGEASKSNQKTNSSLEPPVMIEQS